MVDFLEEAWPNCKANMWTVRNNPFCADCGSELSRCYLTTGRGHLFNKI
jgi:rRNA maturation endonuclease Nob1